ncbi:MAG: hypothetical protein HQL37_14005, partial [Alphaproteobacteria bacterium]|nr:hypothetical protein [Alphaproteobacteria bacterium]
MSAVPPPPPTAVLVQTGATPLVVTVPDPPAALLALPPGTQLEATVASDTQTALTLLNSAVGGFSLRGGPGLVQGTTLTVQVTQLAGQMAGGPVQLRIIGINGQPLQALLPGKGDPAPFPNIGGPIESVTGGGWSTAVALSTPEGGGLQMSRVGDPMSPLSGGIPAVVVHGPLQASSPANGPASQLLSAQQLAPGPASGPGGGGIAPMVTGTQLVVRIAAIQRMEPALDPTSPLALAAVPEPKGSNVSPSSFLASASATTPPAPMTLTIPASPASALLAPTVSAFTPAVSSLGASTSAAALSSAAPTPVAPATPATTSSAQTPAVQTPAAPAPAAQTPAAPALMMPPDSPWTATPRQ